MSTIPALQWRYATKKMNGSSVAEEKIEQIIKAAHLAPTSSGLQPFEIIVITNPELKQKIRGIAFDQSQITDCSHLLVFAAWDNYTEDRIRGVFKHMNIERGNPEDAADDYVNRLLSLYLVRTAEENFNHTARQSYIAFGAAITEAAAQRVDATPMEGFLPDELDALLGLREKGLRSTTILPLGYRDDKNDWLLSLKKVRRPMESFLTEIR